VKMRREVTGWRRSEQGRCKTPDFHTKSESLYHRDSPWISGYRVQNVSQNKYTKSYIASHKGIST
jgi:hypothetical protein